MLRRFERRPQRGRRLPHRFGYLAAAATLAVAAAVTSGGARAEDKQVNTLLYYNNGGYTVKSVTLHWIDDSGTEQAEHFRRDMQLGTGFCYDMRGNDLGTQEGNEVWLSYNIAAGDKQSCRKDGTRMVYKKNSANQHYISEGTTTMSNRCKLGKAPTSVVVGDQRGNCRYDLNY
jgi:hypothetical protein